MSLNLTYLNIGLGKRNHLRQNVDDMKILHFVPFTAALQNDTRVNTQRLFLYPKRDVNKLCGGCVYGRNLGPVQVCHRARYLRSSRTSCWDAWLSLPVT